MDSSDPSQLLSKTGSVVEAMLNLGEVGHLYSDSVQGLIEVEPGGLYPDPLPVGWE